MSSRTSDLTEHQSATGQAMTAAGWLDAHFEACRVEYEATVRAAGIQPGWRVLDAGCGGGSFLPLLAELVGAGGALTAVDLAPDNVAMARERVAGWQLPCPVTVEEGSLLALPYPDATFDAVWCANVVMYFPDEALRVALAEFRRVVRPGGIVAIKDFDVTLIRFPSSVRDLSRNFYATWGGMPGIERGAGLRAWLRRAGFVDVRLATFVMERHAPLPPATRSWLDSAFATLSQMAAGLDLPEDERAEWARLGADRARILDDPDYYYRAGDVLVVGRVPVAVARGDNLGGAAIGCHC